MNDMTGFPPAWPAGVPEHGPIVLVDGDADWRAQAEQALRARGHEVVACDALAGLARMRLPRPAALLIVDAALAVPGWRAEAGAAGGPAFDAGLADCPVLLVVDAREGRLPEQALDGETTDFFVRSRHWALLVDRVRRQCRAARVERELRSRHDERARLEQDMERLISVDALTGLPNRNRFLALCTEAVSEARRAGHQVAVVAIDLDRFAQINESLGQVAGDEAICLVAERLGRGLARLAGSPDPGRDPVLARLPGDAFAVLLPWALDPWRLDEPVDALLQEIARPLTIAGTECFVTGCAGIALYPRDGDAAGLLLSHADSALADAKLRGSRSYRWYAPLPHADARARLKRVSGLHKALERGEFSLSYQPCVDVVRGTLIGVEALARWRHEDEIVPPAEFVPLAEQSGLIVPIGEWAVREASRQIRAWRDAGLRVPKVSVNISTLHFEKPSLAETVRAAIDAHRLEPGMLEIELTESCMVRDFGRTLGALQALRDLGVSLSLDDFGTGYSSLAYLTRLPIGKLKVDRSFVRMLGTSTQGEAVVRAIVALGRSLRLQVLAEGVETVAQARALLGMKCHAMQGFLLSRPVGAAQLPEAIDRIVERCRLASGGSPSARRVRAAATLQGVLQ